MSFPPSTPRHAAFAAFTLIELLVSVAIIALLAAFLLVSVGLVMESARSSRCTNSLRQIGMAGFAYTAVWEGDHCPTNTWKEGQWGNAADFMNQTVYWSQLLAMYFDDEQAGKFSSPDLSASESRGTVFKGCPSAAQRFRAQLAKGNTNAHWQFGYGMNWEKTRNSTKPQDGYDDQWTWAWAGPYVAQTNVYGWRYFHEAAVTQQSSRVWVGDSQYYALWSDFAGSSFPQWDGVKCYGGSRTYTHWQTIPWNDLQEGDSLASSDPLRHKGRANYVFFDGHAGSLAPRDFGKASTHPELP